MVHALEAGNPRVRVAQGRVQGRHHGMQVQSHETTTLTFSSSGVMYSCCSGSIGPPRACEGSSFFTPMRFSICSSTYFCLYRHGFRMFNRQTPTCAEQLQDVQATHRAMHLQSGSSQCQNPTTRPARLTCADLAPHPQTPALAPWRRSPAHRFAAAHPAPRPAQHSSRLQTTGANVEVQNAEQAGAAAMKLLTVTREVL
jgi:hypothetical protein